MIVLTFCVAVVVACIWSTFVAALCQKIITVDQLLALHRVSKKQTKLFLL